MLKVGAYNLSKGETRINSIRFVELEGCLRRACVNTDWMMLSKKSVNTVEKMEARSDIERIEITFLESERAEIDAAIETRLSGGAWPASLLVFFGAELDYAWTVKAIKSGKPYIGDKSIKI